MRSFNPRQVRRDKRDGSSLAEVLVALLVMSIGVVSVASLFPISVLRTVQATQLTNSAQLKYDFDGLSGPRPEIVTGVGEWQPQHAFSPGDLVISTVGNNRYFECQNGFTSGSIEPAWKFATGSSTDEGVDTGVWKTHLAAVYVVDPLGWEERSLEMIARSLLPASNTSDIRNTFGRSNAAGGTFPVDSAYRIVRFRGGVAGNFFNPANTLRSPTNESRTGALGTCVLPDSWLVQADTTDVVNYTKTSIQVQPTNIVTTLDIDGDSVVDLTPSTGAEQAINCRVTLFGVDNRQSVIRQVKKISLATNEQISWVTDLPVPFRPVRVRVETFQPRFSWMLAARRQVSGAIYMDLITFYKRSFDPVHELIHPAHFNSNSSTVVIQYNTALGAASPALRKGGFICDAQNNRWYRVINFTEVDDSLAAMKLVDTNITTSPLQSTRGASVSLEYVALQSSGYYSGTDANAPGGAIVLPGIINVYPLQPKLPWEE